MPHREIKKLFDQKLTLEQATEQLDQTIPYDLIAEYWRLLEMEAAIAEASPYFERLNAMLM